MIILYTPTSNDALDELLNDALSRVKSGGSGFSGAEAWIWLYKKAAIKPCSFVHPQGVFQVQRGQLVFPYRDGQRFWGWGRTRTEGFLRRLESRGEIELSQLPLTLEASGKPDIKTGITCVTVCLLNGCKSKEKYKHDRVSASSKPIVRQGYDVIKGNNEEEERRKASESLTVKNGGDPIHCGHNFQALVDDLKGRSPPVYRQPKD